MTNNGLEFFLDVFNSYCTINGIERHNKTARTPQQNGLSKRFNMTILERVRCLILSGGLNKVYSGLV